MLSYHADADINTNPFELGLERLVDLEMETDFIGKAALTRIRDEGVERRQVGLVLDCAPLQGPNTTFWQLAIDGQAIGKVTSAIYSPRLEKNIALAIVQTGFDRIGQQLEAATSMGTTPAVVVEKPFFDPKKKIAAS